MSFQSKVNNVKRSGEKSWFSRVRACGDQRRPAACGSLSEPERLRVLFLLPTLRIPRCVPQRVRTGQTPRPRTALVDGRNLRRIRDRSVRILVCLLVQLNVPSLLLLQNFLKNPIPEEPWHIQNQTEYPCFLMTYKNLANKCQSTWWTVLREFTLQDRVTGQNQ